MKTMKKWMVLALVLALLPATLCFAFAEEAEEEAPDTLRRLRLGSSNYAVMIDGDFVRDELTQEDIESGLVGCFTCGETGLEFDVYQIGKEGRSEALRHYVLERANEFENVQLVVPHGNDVNGIDVVWFTTLETVEGVEYETMTIVFDDVDSYVEMEFWMTDDDNEDDDDEAGRIMESLRRLEFKQIQLGDSDFFITVPADFEQGEMTEEDVADDQVAYWYSEASLLDFDVYQFAKDGLPETLAEYVVQEAGEYQGVTELTTDGDIDGVPAAWYRAVEEYEDGEYDTITFIFDGGDEYVEVVFWLDGPTAGAEADSIIRSISIGA